MPEAISYKENPKKRMAYGLELMAALTLFMVYEWRFYGFVIPEDP